MKKETLFVAIAITSFYFSTFLLISCSNAAATPLSNQNGTISGIQNGPDGRSAWKVAGTWNLTNQSSKSPTFNASFDMMKLDGSSKHKHTVTATITSADFKVAGKSSTRTYSGTATISMKEGPISNVPIVIKQSSDGNMSIMPDPIKTKGHFGNTPIQGKVQVAGAVLKFKAHKDNP
jgi:hypothetical protein